jgi:hypothetical protein
MRCLRITTPDGESRFGEVDIAMTMTPPFPNEVSFEVSAYPPPGRVRFVHVRRLRGSLALGRTSRMHIEWQ